MATKAQRYKAEMQRAARAQHASRSANEYARRLVEKRRRAKDRFPNPTSHNESPRLAKKTAYELEPTATVRPPRKSTRRSPSHLKTDSALRIRAMTLNASPKVRANRPSGNPT